VVPVPICKPTGPISPWIILSPHGFQRENLKAEAPAQGRDQADREYACRDHQLAVMSNFRRLARVVWVLDRSLRGRGPWLRPPCSASRCSSMRDFPAHSRQLRAGPSARKCAAQFRRTDLQELPSKNRAGANLEISAVGHYRAVEKPHTALLDLAGRPFLWTATDVMEAPATSRHAHRTVAHVHRLG